MSKKYSSKVSAFEAISNKEVESILSLLEKAQQSVGQTTVLSTAGRRSAPKLRRGAQQVIPTIATLATKHQLAPPSMSVSDMTSRIDHAERLREVLGAVTVFQKLLKDTILVSEGTAWQTATATYATLRRAAKSQPTLAAELAPVLAWFRARVSAAAAPVDGTPEASAAVAPETPAAAAPKT
jgi:hypothetical protein